MGRIRGFAALDEARRKEIAALGGKALWRKGLAHRFTPDEAASAGRKGRAVAGERGTVYLLSNEDRTKGGRSRRRSSESAGSIREK